MLKKAISLALACIGAVSLCSCGASKPSSESVEKEITIKSGYTRVDVNDTNGKKTTGFGTQFDTCILESENALKADEWQKQIDVVKEMNLQCIRVRFYPECYERANDNNDPDVFDFDSENIDFNSAEMKLLYKLFDACEQNGVKIDLSWYGCRATFSSIDGKVTGSWLGGTFGVDADGWMTAPKKGDKPEEEFAESVASCLYYLIHEKKYTCVNEYSIFPEPDGVISDINKMSQIASSIKNRLEKYGIKDKITFSGPADYNNNPEVFEQKYLSKIEFEKATSSVYKFNSSSYNETIYEFAKNYTAVTDKHNIDWAVAESGTSNFLTAVTNSDSETYERALFMPRFMINMVNGGCTGIKYFVFSDCYYDGILNKLGLFCFRHEDWKAKPVFYSWSLVTKYTDINSEIFPLETGIEDVNATAFRLPDGSWSYMLTNNGLSNARIAIVNTKKDKPDKLNYYKMTGSSIPENRELKTIEASSEIDSSSGVAYVVVPAEGFVVLSNKNA